MKFTTQSFVDGRQIPETFAFGKPHEKNHITLSSNRNPHFSWSDLPTGTKSLVLICHDPDAPSKGDDVNKEDRSVPAALPRTDFFHWVLIDLAPTPGEIREGEFSKEVTPRGKAGPIGPQGTRQGINDYTNWFANDHDMSGQYFGYDGPCPPWNDEIPHRYIFTLYALDIERCPVENTFTGQQVRDVIVGHVLDQAHLIGIYTLNPSIKM